MVAHKLLMNICFRGAYMPNIKCVIFDMDGTMCDTLPLAAECFMVAIEKVSGKKVLREDIEKTYGANEIGTLITFLGEENSSVAHKAYLDHYAKRHGDKPFDKPFDGIIEIINYLKGKGVKLYIVTSRAVESAVLTLDFYNLSDKFDGVYTGENFVNVKEKNIKEIVKSNGFNPNEVYYVGDTAGDVRESKKAGIKTISALWSPSCFSENVLKENPDHAFYSVSQCLNFFKENV